MNDNIVIVIVIICDTRDDNQFIKCKNREVHNTTIMITTQWNDIVGVTFRTFFFQLMNNKIIDSQSEFTRL